MEDEARPVSPAPGLPGRDDEDPHGADGSPPVAVVVATRDRPELLEGALNALAGVLRPQDELVVVDSASTKDTTRVLCERLGVRVITAPAPGTSLARNTGVAATTADLVAFTDDDCLPQPGWTAALAAAFQPDPRIGLVTGRVLADREVAAPLSLQESKRTRYFTYPTGHGANCCFRRTAFDAVGGFDERLGPGAPGAASEDADLMRRVLAEGWYGYYEPTAVVTHRQWRGRRAAIRRSYAYGRGQAAAGAGFRDAVWHDALRPAMRDLRAGYLTGVAVGLHRAAGAFSWLARRR
jgi:GT2 family glycosyltransferase